jgi:tetratricopeptide (TPR) repeat protein
MVKITELDTNEDEQQQQQTITETTTTTILSNDNDPTITHPASWLPNTNPIPPRSYKHDIHHPAAIISPKRDAKHASELKTIGNELFSAKKYDEAIEAYSEALDICPSGDEHSYARAVFYSNRAACFMELKKYEEAIADCTRCIKLDPRYLKAYVRRSKANEALDNLDDALADMKEAVQIDARAPNVFMEHARLEKAVKEKNEKLKDEMMGKLKDLGNTILGKFGMSLDNFKMVQDPNTGSYSVSYQS